jgi:hypothetical protein
VDAAAGIDCLQGEAAVAGLMTSALTWIGELAEGILENVGPKEG